MTTMRGACVSSLQSSQGSSPWHRRPTLICAHSRPSRHHHELSPSSLHQSWAFNKLAQLSVGPVSRRISWYGLAQCRPKGPQGSASSSGNDIGPNGDRTSSEGQSADLTAPADNTSSTKYNTSSSGSSSNSSSSSSRASTSADTSTTSKPSLQSRSLWASLLQFADQQVLPLLLITMLCVGLAVPAWGQAAAAAGLTRGVTVFIFVIAGLQLRRGEAAAALQAWGCVAWGLASILLFTPLLGLMLQSLPMPADVRPLLLGTAVFCAMPTTLSSGISMTTAAGGNTALAILLTIASNLLGVLTLPVTLPLVCGAGGGGALSPVALLRQLLESVLLPTLVGAMARVLVPGLARLVDSNKRPVVWISSACLAVVPWMQVSRAVGGGLAIPVTQVLLSFALGVAVHVAFLLFNWVAVVALGLGGPQPLPRAQLRQALVLQASQKTLPVAIAVVAEGAVASQLGPVGSGLAAMGAVAGHLAQVLVDSLLISRWTEYIQTATWQQEELYPAAS